MREVSHTLVGAKDLTKRPVATGIPACKRASEAVSNIFNDEPPTFSAATLRLVLLVRKKFFLRVVINLHVCKL